MEGFEETPALSPASQQGSCLWIGDLSVWMDENWLKHTFLPTSALVSCKVIRHKTTQMSRGYGFLLFNSHEAANFVLTQLNGKLIPGTDQVFRLNWAANGRQGATGPSDYSLFVGDLTEEVTDYMLQEAFRRYYPSVRSAKVMRAPLSGRSRNFGFCRFANQQERDRALVEMNGHEICDRPVRVSLATAKKIQPGGAGLDAPPAAAENTFNATLFVGGLTDAASEEDLRGMFSLFGDLVSVKCLAAKGCAFVQYQTAAAAKAAMTMLQDQAIGGAPMRISWGRQNSVPRPPAPNFANSTSSYSYPGAVIPGSTFNPEYGGPRLAGVGGHPVSLPPHSYPAPQDSYGAHDPAALLAHPRLPNLGGHSSGMSMAPGVPPLQQGMPDAQQVEQLFGNLALHAGGSRNIQRPFM